MDTADDFRLRQDEKVVVAAEILRMLPEAIAPEFLLRETKLLDHCAHRPVEQEDAT